MLKISRDVLSSHAPNHPQDDLKARILWAAEQRELDAKRCRLAQRGGAANATSNGNGTDSGEGWQCPLCTLMNDPDATVCGCCASARGMNGGGGVSCAMGFGG
jgi:hypothetical protein